MEGESFLKRNICGYVVVLFYLFIYLLVFIFLSTMFWRRKKKQKHSPTDILE